MITLPNLCPTVKHLTETKHRSLWFFSVCLGNTRDEDSVWKGIYIKHEQTVRVRWALSTALENRLNIRFMSDLWPSNLLTCIFEGTTLNCISNNLKMTVGLHFANVISLFFLFPSQRIHRRAAHTPYFNKTVKKEECSFHSHSSTI